MLQPTTSYVHFQGQFFWDRIQQKSPSQQVPKKSLPGRFATEKSPISFTKKINMANFHHYLIYIFHYPLPIPDADY